MKEREPMTVEGPTKHEPYCEMCGDPAGAVLVFRERGTSAQARRAFCHYCIQEIASLTTKEVRRVTR